MNKKRSDKTEKKPLETLVTAKGFTFLTLSQKSGVSYDSIKSYNQGRRSPTIEYAAKMCRTLDCSFKELAKSLGVDVEGVPDDLPLK